MTALLQIERADLLPRLFERIVIPPAVRAELLREHANLPLWLETRSPITIPNSVALAQLDLGETEALALALELRADAVLVDERLGRRVARALGLRVTGLLGTLILAKQRGHLEAVMPVVEELRTRAGCWFDDALIADVLRAAGEPRGLHRWSRHLAHRCKRIRRLADRTSDHLAESPRSVHPLTPPPRRTGPRHHTGDPLAFLDDGGKRRCLARGVRLDRDAPVFARSASRST